MSDIEEVHKFSIKRLVVTDDAVGGQTRTYTTAARGGLPASAKGRAVALTEKERNEFGVRGQVIGWKIMTTTNPKIELQDRVEFEYVPGENHVVRVLVASRARSADANFWKCICEEVTQEVG